MQELKGNINIAIPKGRIGQDFFKLLKEKLPFTVEKDFFTNTSRKLMFETSVKHIKIIRVRSFDVATFVSFGAASIGICGSDVLAEFSYHNIFHLKKLGIGKCKMVVASPAPPLPLPPPSSPKNKAGGEKEGEDKLDVASSASSSRGNYGANSATDAGLHKDGLFRDGLLARQSHVKIGTKYPNITKGFFAKKSVQAECIKLNGAIEIAPRIGLCNHIVDLVETGKTLQENGLIATETIMDVESLLIVNKEHYLTDCQKITEIIKKF